MKIIITGFLICNVCMWFTTIWGGTIGTISAYAYWIGVILIICGIITLKE